MAKRAALTLDTMKAAKPAVVELPPAPSTQSPIKNRASDGRRGQTLRLTVDAWRQLKHLAADEDCSSHDLLKEAVNRLFIDRGKPPTA